VQARGTAIAIPPSRKSQPVRQGCAEDLGTEALLERLMGAVRGFAGEAPQKDDQTVVVLEVEG